MILLYKLRSLVIHSRQPIPPSIGKETRSSTLPASKGRDTDNILSFFVDVLFKPINIFTHTRSLDNIIAFFKKKIKKLNPLPYH